jgi:stage IV sporulation protein FB
VFLAEPPPTQFDLHFRLAGTPVRIHPFFWVSTLILGISGGGRTPPAELLVWIVAVVVSILIHEFGHTIAQRLYGGHPRIILYGFGGLAVCSDCDRSTKSQILISLAGPVAGFLFAAVVLLAVRAVGHRTGILWGSEVPLGALGLKSARVMSILGMSFYWQPFPSENVDHMIGNLLWINGLWGAVNLLPIYPLDGGHVSRELCQLGQPRQGIILSLQISMVAAGVMVLVGLSWRSWLVPIFFAYLAYSSYRTLEAYRASQW